MNTYRRDRGVGPVPHCVELSATALYRLHVYLLVEMTRELIRLFGEMYGEEGEVLERAGRMWIGLCTCLEGEGHLLRETLRKG
jgi:hypothetical protein